MSVSERGVGDVQRLEVELTAFLGPYEPLIMSIQSILVWEHPWKSSILFTVAHVLFWFFYTTSARFFFLLSVLIMVIVFVDTWKNRIWPEIRVPPKEPEDKDGWTPVHPHLLSVPEISCRLSGMYMWMIKAFRYLRNYRISHPLVFCLGNTAFFTITATIGCHISGFTLAYLTMMGLMLWPCIIYHSLLKMAYKKIEPGFEWMQHHVLNKCQVIISKAQCIKSKLNPSQKGGSGEPAMTEEDFIPQVDSEITAALAKAISDSEDDTGNSTIPTPGLSESPSFNNSEEDTQDMNFEFGMNQMPSFDDLDNTDDEIDLPTQGGANGNTHSNLSRFNTLQFTSAHFGDSESEDDVTVAENLDFADTNFSNNAATNPSSSLSPASVQNLAGAFVARTISSMMQSALQGVSTLTQGQTVTSSSVLPRTGAKITYTCSEEGESIDFQNPQPTILELEEEESSRDNEMQNEHIAEIEKDFDFLHDLDSDSG